MFFFCLLLLYIFIRLSVFLILINNNIIIVFFLLLPLLLLLFTSVSVTILGENFNFQLFYWMCRRLVTTLLQCATAAPRCGGKHFTRNVKLWNISNSPQRGSHAFCVGCWFIKILFCFCSSSLYALFFFGFLNILLTTDCLISLLVVLFWFATCLLFWVVGVFKSNS